MKSLARVPLCVGARAAGARSIARACRSALRELKCGRSRGRGEDRKWRRKRLKRFDSDSRMAPGRMMAADRRQRIESRAIKRAPPGDSRDHARASEVSVDEPSVTAGRPDFSGRLAKRVIKA